ncbi:hypothetical protein [Prevotella sp.]|uniref:hypothetical protein n=1 Tax=Prevotella sp. TaxID=59823 RepID=UPI00307C5022
MGDNTTAALISAGASAAGGLVGLLSNSAHRQYKYQKKLMQQQNAMNQENATIAYNRSRQLTLDQALLEKQGKFNAGINTAFGQDGNVANAASAPQSDGVSIPTPPDVMGSLNSFQTGINNAVNQLVSAATARANVRKLNSEADGIDIDNLTRNYRNMKQAGLLTAQIDKMTKETLHQSIVNKHAESREAAAEEEDNARANIASMDASIRGAMNEIDYLNKVQDIQNKIATGELTKRQGAVELKKLSLMDSQIRVNNASAGELNTRSQLNVENSRGVALDNRLKTLTFDNKLVESFESAEQSKLRTVGMKLKNLPHSVSEHFTRSALFALDRIQKGHGSAADFALVAAQTSREYVQYANNEAKDWTKILLGALPLSSAGAAQTGERGSGYVVNPPYVPQY